MTKRNLFAALMAVAMLVLCLSGSIAFAEEEVDFIQDIAYMGDDNKDHFLDVFGYEEGGELKPLVLEIHGGGFIGGSKKTNTDHSRVYEENGFAVVTPNYTHLPKGNFSNIVQEMFAVMHWIEENAQEYNFDLNNVFIGGDSAGGFIVQLLLCVMNSEELQAYYEVENPGYQFKCAVLSCPKFDIMADRELVGQDLGSKSFSANQIADVIMDDEHMKYVDLLTNYPTDGLPILYIITTPGDDLLYEEAVQLDTFLSEKGIEHIYIEYENVENELGHVFNIGNVDYVESIQANEESISYLQSLIG